MKKPRRKHQSEPESSAVRYMLAGCSHIEDLRGRGPLTEPEVFAHGVDEESRMVFVACKSCHEAGKFELYEYGHCWVDPLALPKMTPISKREAPPEVKYQIAGCVHAWRSLLLLGETNTPLFNNDGEVNSKNIILTGYYADPPMLFFVCPECETKAKAGVGFKAGRMVGVEYSIEPHLIESRYRLLLGDHPTVPTTLSTAKGKQMAEGKPLAVRYADAAPMLVN